MADLVTVVSRVHMAIRIQEPLPAEYKDRPGEAPMLKSAVLAGSNDPGAKGGRGVTHNVDAAMFRAWHEAQVRGNTPLADLVSIHEGDEEPTAMEFGFEPGLARLAANEQNAEAAEKGSATMHSGPVSSAEMAATSDTPNDDSPRGDPDVVPVARTAEPATHKVEAHEEDNHHD